MPIEETMPAVSVGRKSKKNLVYSRLYIQEASQPAAPGSPMKPTGAGVGARNDAEVNDTHYLLKHWGNEME